MSLDEQKIRDLIRTWGEATELGQVDTVLALMTDDAVFLTPGQEPFGKKRFAQLMAATAGKMTISTHSHIVDLVVDQKIAYSRTQLTVTISVPDRAPKIRFGQTLTIFRKTDAGDWLLARDANLLG